MKTISAIAFILILLLQSAGLTFGTHYCGGHAVKSALMVGVGNLDCGMEQMANGCDRHSQTGISKKACCENEIVSIHTDNEFNSDSTIPVPTAVGLFALQCTTPHWYSAPVPYSDDYSKYPPPLIESDLHALLQVFRI